MFQRCKVLDEGKLENGDIILTTSPHKYSAVIRFFTKSKYSHAAIYIGDAILVEAVGCGVRVSSSRIKYSYGSHILHVYRIRDDRLKARAVRAAENATKYVGNRYWSGGAIVSIQRIFYLKNKYRFFCSQLVAQCYADAGLMLQPGESLENVTPEKLARSKFLREVSDEVLVDCLIEQTDLDELQRKKTDPVQIERQIFQEIFDSFEGTLKRADIKIYYNQENPLLRALIPIENCADENLRTFLDAAFCDAFDAHDPLVRISKAFSQGAEVVEAHMAADGTRDWGEYRKEKIDSLLVQMTKSALTMKNQAEENQMFAEDLVSAYMKSNVVSYSRMATYYGVVADYSGYLSDLCDIRCKKLKSLM